jgi:DNA-binding NtrC family response regulator
LGVDRGALYLRTIRDEPFQLMAFAGVGGVPNQLPLDASFLTTLKEQGSLQRITPGSRSELSPEQALLWEWDVDLVHGLDSSEDTLGLVLLGHKRHAISFTSEDLTFLNALGQIANVAMYSAQVVDQNISRLNAELELKLEKIADQQRQIALLQAQITHWNEEPSQSLPAKTAFRRDACKGNSPAMQNVLDMARKVAASESSVLIRGESGTGKEVLAQVLHDNSARAGKPMIRVHCAALSPGLLESELFGHVKGAFTGAHQDRVGRFEAANGGTLFLDEIGDISLDTQIKLLRVLQERCFEPVGSVRTVNVDVRLITATHQNLESLIESGKFREDLFYRLNVIRLELPPLREHREDILELSLHFLRRAAQRMGKPLTHIDDGALESLVRYHWPGNIRELENVIERAVVMAEGTVLTLADLPSEVLSPRPSRRKDSVRLPPPLVQHAALKSDTVFVEPGKDPFALHPPQTPSAQESPNPETPRKTRRKLAAIERQELQKVLEECGGNKAQAALVLGIPRSTLFSKLKRHGLT